MIRWSTNKLINWCKLHLIATKLKLTQNLNNILANWFVYLVSNTSLTILLNRVDDPVPVRLDVGVDTRNAFGGATDAPADNTGQVSPAELIVANKGPARVTLGGK